MKNSQDEEVEHYCVLPKGAAEGVWGHAITECSEYLDGRMFVDNDEYESQVNFCPFCGQKAKVQIGDVSRLAIDKVNNKV